MFKLTDVVFKYVSVALLVACLGMGVTIYIQNGTIKAKEDKINDLATQVADLTVKLNAVIKINEDLNVAIDTQNKAIKQLESDKKALDERLTRAVNDVRKVKADYQKRIDELMREPVSNDCNSSLNWLRIKAPELSIMPSISTIEPKPLVDKDATTPAN